MTALVSITHMDTSCHIWMSHVTYEWVMSNTYESRHRVRIFSRHTTALVSIKNMNTSRHMSHMNESYEGVMSHMNESCHVWMSPVKYESVTSQAVKILEPDNGLVPIIHMNMSCHMSMSHITYEWVISHMNELYHIWMSHITYECVTSHMNESRHIWMSHVTVRDYSSNRRQRYRVATICRLLKITGLFCKRAL